MSSLHSTVNGTSKMFEQIDYDEVSTICKYKGNLFDYSSFYPSNRRYLICSNKKLGNIEAYDTFRGKRIRLTFKKSPEMSHLSDYIQLSSFQFLNDDSGLFLVVLNDKRVSILVLAKLDIKANEIDVVSIGTMHNGPRRIGRPKIVLNSFETEDGKLPYIIDRYSGFSYSYIPFQLIAQDQKYTIKLFNSISTDHLFALKMISLKKFCGFRRIGPYADFDRLHIVSDRKILRCMGYIAASRMGHRKPIVDAFHWHGNQFYCAIKPLDRENQMAIFTLKLFADNLENMRWKEVMCGKFENLPITTLAVDHNDLMILKLVKNVDGEQTEQYCQYPLRNPQSLTELAFFSTQRSNFKHVLTPDFLDNLQF